jgi:hypothetical protein
MKITTGLPVGGDFRAHGKTLGGQAIEASSLRLFDQLDFALDDFLRAMSATPMLGRVGMRGSGRC